MNKKIRIGALAVVMVGASWVAASTLDSNSSTANRLDTLQRELPQLEQKVLSTLYNGISSPVAIDGSLRLKAQYHRFAEHPVFLGPRALTNSNSDTVGRIHSDYTYLQTGWDQAMAQLEMIVNPGRNTVLWSKLAFSHTFPGNRLPSRSLSTMSYKNPDSATEVASRHSIQNFPVNTFEDLYAGLAIRTKPASAWLKMGNMLWIEASPLSIWRAEPRLFAWDYLPWEDDQGIADYYDQKVATGMAQGRAAWHKKAFTGINLESIELPANLYLDFVYGRFDAYDTFEREFLDFSTDLGYAADTISKGITIETGVGDPYRRMLHTRLAETFVRDLMAGINFTGVTISPDIIYAQSPDCFMFNSAFQIGPYPNDPRYRAGSGTWDSVIDPTTKKKVWKQVDFGRGFYKAPYDLSLDFRGTLSSLFSLQAEAGVSMIDTTWVVADTISDKSTQYFYTDYENTPIRVKSRYHRYSKPVPAVYSQVKFTPSLGTATVDVAYMGKGYYSPFSFVSPMDAFWPFGSNLTLQGMFPGTTDANPYIQNMTGAQLTVSPKLPLRGHCNLRYGLHRQIEKSRDLLFFPYRLNGDDMNSTLYSTTSKYGTGTVDFPMHYNYYPDSGTPEYTYDRRLGDESYKGFGSNAESDPFAPKHLEQGPDIGGLHSGEMSLYESFVPYPDSASAAANLNDTIYSVSKRDAMVPAHVKWTYNFELDASYDISSFFGYRYPLFIGGYGSINGISIEPTVLSVNSKNPNILLWSWYVHLEPAIALTKSFYLVGLLGWENWRAENAWMEGVGDDPDNAGSLVTVGSKKVIRVPINYFDYAGGMGFDWDMSDRVSLHGRFKSVAHKDREFDKIQDQFIKEYPGYIRRTNNWSGPLGSLELKVFF
jgi:hypothetical protein